MDLSVVSGTFNRIKYLQAMVSSVRESIKDLRGFEYEIVLVDGGSTDGTIEWCNSQPDIRLIQHGRLLGAVKAFNDGAYAATGQYVIMANDDIEFVDNSIALAYIHMVTNSPYCGVGCFYQNRNGRDWHVESMPAVTLDRKQVHVYYGQVCIVPKWLGDLVGWWCREEDFIIHGFTEGLHTYGGDNELSAKIVDLGFDIQPISSARILDKEADDDLRASNNIGGTNSPEAVKGHHPDSWKWGKRWLRRNERIGYPRLAGPIVKDKPQIESPRIEMKERVLYLPIFEQGWQVQKEQKRGLRDALAKKTAIVIEYDYFSAYNRVGKDQMMANLRQQCQEFRPTIIIMQLHNSDFINPGDLKVLKSITNARMINWNGDYWPDQLLDEKGIELAKSFDLMTTVNRDVMEKHQAQGINTRYWQIGWEPDGRDHNPDKHYDIVFLASGYSSKRQKLGAFLKELPYKVGLYGNGWPNNWSEGENLYNFKEACKVYRGAKIAIGDSQWPESGFVSNRIFQILAAGNCVLCHQWFRGIELLGLKHGENCIIWDGKKHLETELNYWLSPENQTPNKQAIFTSISKAGERLALEKHSFDNRIDELWQMLSISEQSQDEDWRW